MRNVEGFVSGLIQQLKTSSSFHLFASPSSEYWFLFLGSVPHGHKMAAIGPDIMTSHNHAHRKEAG